MSGSARHPAPPTERQTTRRRAAAFALLAGALAVAAVAALALGSVRLSPGDVVGALVAPDRTDRRAVTVVRTVRLPRTGAASLVGAALAVSGAQMQTVFRNPLADPFVLGVSGGASFGVAVVVLAAGTGASAWIGGLAGLGNLSVAGAAFAGALATTLVSLAAARRVRGTASVLVVGLMVGYVLSALVSVLVAAADPARLQQYVAWGLGSFRGVTAGELRVLAPAVGAGLAAALALAKPLNALLLGERYAESMGVPVRRARLAVLASASLLAGVATAFAGPIAFVGVAVPHLARPLVRTSDHRVLLPACVLLGATVALVAEVAAQLPGRAGVLPLNAVTALLGAPVVVGVLVRRSRAEVIT
ncbi:MAG TPA: iron ABC transporter permease [Acidimicrobiales bacterium]|jgi:iron complex transport system permease protein